MTMTPSITSDNLSNVYCLNLSKPPLHPNTGIGFFNHMLDQITSHAQIGTSATVSSLISSADDMGDRNRYGDSDELQKDIVSLVGSNIGKSLGELLPSSSSSGGKSRFCCPLDEALVECILTIVSHPNDKGSLKHYSLAPYGAYPPSTGRTKIGTLSTSCLPSFFTAMAESMGVDIELIKHRGENGHHIVESAFKAFSRALRNLVDGVDTMGVDDDAVVTSKWWDAVGRTLDDAAGLPERSGKIERETKETAIKVNLVLTKGGISVDTGVSLLDDIIVSLATAADVSLMVHCRGDLYVDDHHTSEDVAIAIGQCLDRALGTKGGLNRMWSGRASVGDATVEVVMDLSNRPCLTQDLDLCSEDERVEMVDGMSIEMIYHFFESLVCNGRMTVHILQLTKDSVKIKDVVLATAAAFGKCLKMCIAIDPRRGGVTASSKGTLSV